MTRPNPPVLAFWLLNAAAFWLAEMLAAVAPLDGEPAWVFALALAGYLAIALAGGGASWLLARRLPALVPWSRWLAFAPGAVLLAPKLRVALENAPGSAVLVAALVAAVAGLLFFAWRSSSGLWSYGWGALALWLVAFRFQDLAFIAEVGTTRLTTPWWLIALGVIVCLAWLLVGRGRSWWTNLAGLAVVGLRLLVPPPFEPGIEPEEGRQRPGATPVIVIVMDTTRADHLSLYGYPRDTSPELVKLAEEAMVFERTVAPSSWTLPSHASLFTSLYPLRHGALRLPWLEEESGDLEAQGIHRPAFPLPKDRLTMAEWFREQGYATASVAANFAYLDPAFQVDQGFDFYDAWRNVAVRPRLLEVIHRRLVRLPSIARYWQVYRSARQINDVALEWLGSRSSKRFFLFLNYMEPHEPWGPHLPGLRYEQFAAEPEAPPAAHRRRLEPGMRRRVDLYDSQIAALDQALGELFERLRKLGIWEEALVVITSDHGESFGENGIDGHGKSLNEPEVAIPLLIKYPRARQVGRSTERVQLVDLWPTIATELSLPFPEGLEGQPVGKVTHPILAEDYTDPREPPEVFHGYRAALYENDWKLIARSDGATSIFDLANDPWESTDLATEQQELIDRNLEPLLERQRLLEKQAWAAREQAPLDPEVEAGLKALGYL